MLLSAYQIARGVGVHDGGGEVGVQARERRTVTPAQAHHTRNHPPTHFQSVTYEPSHTHTHPSSHTHIHAHTNTHTSNHLRKGFRFNLATEGLVGTAVSASADNESVALLTSVTATRLLPDWPPVSASWCTLLLDLGARPRYLGEGEEGDGVYG